MKYAIRCYGEVLSTPYEIEADSEEAALLMWVSNRLFFARREVEIIEADKLASDNPEWRRYGIDSRIEHEVYAL